MNSLPEVNICIPTANLGERSLEYLECCLSSIEDQDYPNITVIISDHSKDDDVSWHLVDNWLDEEGKRPFKLRYTRYYENYGNAVANLNNAIDQASKGSLIKMLFQDDILKTKKAISTMVTCLRETGRRWLGAGCDHIDDNDDDMNHSHLPCWVGDLSLAYGENLIGSPSVVMFQNCDLRMDSNLCYLNDCEFYYRMGKIYGSPALLHEELITIRMRSQGLSSTLDLDKVKMDEIAYLDKKYD